MSSNILDTFGRKLAAKNLKIAHSGYTEPYHPTYDINPKEKRCLAELELS